jgi:hypothetical protein
MDKSNDWEAVLQFDEPQFVNGSYVPNTTSHINVFGLTAEQAHQLIDAPKADYRWLSWTKENKPRVHIQFK